MDILFEDNHIIAVNKSNHDLVQKDITEDHSLDQKVKDYIKEKYKKPGNVFLGVVHRLDRPVSGAVLFARTGKALSRLNKMFRENEVGKIYHAIVKKKPLKDEDTLINYLTRNQKQNKSYCYNKEVPGSKRAELDYKVIGVSDNYFLLEITLKTGRHHQIRCQLANIGCPVKGDLKYGFPRSNPDGGISLHAWEVRFVHPVSKKEIRIVAEYPEEERLWEMFQVSND